MSACPAGCTPRVYGMAGPMFGHTVCDCPPAAPGQKGAAPAPQSSAPPSATGAAHTPLFDLMIEVAVVFVATMVAGFSDSAGKLLSAFFAGLVLLWLVHHYGP